MDATNERKLYTKTSQKHQKTYYLYVYEQNTNDAQRKYNLSLIFVNFNFKPKLLVYIKKYFFS